MPIWDIYSKRAKQLPDVYQFETVPGPLRPTSAGDLNVLGVTYPRMQMLTVPQVLAGERFATPTAAAGHVPGARLPGT